MRILVTGCCGFIGYHFCKRILDIGHTVVGIDNMNNYYDVSMKWKRLDEIKYKITNPSEYISRIYTELDVIDKLGFNSYFLIMQDLVNNAKINGIKTGPGRGSVCGSIVAYLTGITKIDSIKYDLLFDRFLSIHRTGSIPDVDMDIASAKR